jgi:hypothetical protein
MRATLARKMATAGIPRGREFCLYFIGFLCPTVGNLNIFNAKNSNPPPFPGLPPLGLTLIPALRFPGTSTQQQLGPTSVSVDSSGFATCFPMANPFASQIGQSRSTIVNSSVSTPPTQPVVQPAVQPAYVQAMCHNTSSTVSGTPSSGTPSYFSELFPPRHSDPGRVAPGEVLPVNEQYNIVQPGIQSAQFPTPSLEFSPFLVGPGIPPVSGKLVSGKAAQGLFVP